MSSSVVNDFMRVPSEYSGNMVEEQKCDDVEGVRRQKGSSNTTSPMVISASSSPMPGPMPVDLNLDSPVLDVARRASQVAQEANKAALIAQENARVAQDAAIKIAGDANKVINWVSSPDVDGVNLSVVNQINGLDLGKKTLNKDKFRSLMDHVITQVNSEFSIRVSKSFFFDTVYVMANLMVIADRNDRTLRIREDSGVELLVVTKKGDVDPDARRSVRDSLR